MNNQPITHLSNLRDGAALRPWMADILNKFAFAQSTSRKSDGRRGFTVYQKLAAEHGARFMASLAKIEDEHGLEIEHVIAFPGGTGGDWGSYQPYTGSMHVHLAEGSAPLSLYFLRGMSEELHSRDDVAIVQAGVSNHKANPYFHFAWNPAGETVEKLGRYAYATYTRPAPATDWGLYNAYLSDRFDVFNRIMGETQGRREADFKRLAPVNFADNDNLIAGVDLCQFTNSGDGAEYLYRAYYFDPKIVTPETVNAY